MDEYVYQSFNINLALFAPTEALVKLHEYQKRLEAQGWEHIGGKDEQRIHERLTFGRYMTQEKSGDIHAFTMRRKAEES